TAPPGRFFISCQGFDAGVYLSAQLTAASPPVPPHFTPPTLKENPMRYLVTLFLLALTSGFYAPWWVTLPLWGATFILGAFCLATASSNFMLSISGEDEDIFTADQEITNLLRQIRRAS